MNMIKLAGFSTRHPIRLDGAAPFTLKQGQYAREQ